MFEIIKRTEGQRSQKEPVRGSDVQVSLNDWGHLVVRVIQDETVIDKENSKEDYIAQIPLTIDTLVVFDKDTSSRIIRFIKDCVK